MPAAWRAALCGVGVALASVRADELTAPAVSSDFFVRTWDTDDSLPYLWFNQVVQDATGFIWFATSGGLSRYDGHEFKEIRPPKRFCPNGDNIRGLALEDKQTLLLLPTSNEVVRLKDGKFSPHPVCRDIVGKVPVDLFVEASGAVWLGMKDGSLLRWENGMSRWLALPKGIDPSPGDFSFAIGPEGETWIALGPLLARYREGRLLRFNTGSDESMVIASGAKGSLWICTPTRLQRLEDGRLRTLSNDVPWKDQLPALHQYIEDRDGALWFAAGRHGLHRWTGHGFTRIEAPAQIMSVHEDREGNIWFASVGFGIGRARKKTYRLLDRLAGLPITATNGVHISAAGEVWLANNHRRGEVLRVKENRMEPVNLAFAARPPVVNTLCTDQAGNLWCGGQDGLYFTSPPFDLPPVKLPEPIRDLHLLYGSRRGDMWFATAQGELGYYRDGAARMFTEKEHFAGQIIRAIVEDDEGRIWLGAQNGDLLSFDGTRLTRMDGLPEEPIHDLYIDQAGLLWVATSVGLLLRDEAGSFHHFTRADGLADELIGRILEDDRGMLWLLSRSGIYYVEKKNLLALRRRETKSLISHRFGRDQGLAGVTPLMNYHPSKGRAADGRLWLATTRGVVVLDPSGVPLDLAPPPILIDEVLVDGIPPPAPTGIELPSSPHRIEFHFAVPGYSSTKIQLNHWLQGADPGWVETPESRRASYSGLAPGAYRLQVRARHGMGAWNTDSGGVEFTVRPAWWQNPWMQIGILVGVSAALAGAIRHWSQRLLKQRLRRIEQQHAIEIERSRISRNLHDELGGSLTEMSLLADRLRSLPPGDLPHGLARLSARARRLHVELASIIWTVSPSNNSLDRFASFLRRYATRLFRHSPVACIVTGTESIPQKSISPELQHQLLAIAKESLNNVLTHAHATRVVVTTRFAGNRFTLTIEDNGVGFAPDSLEESQGNGLNNLRARVAEIGGTMRLVSAPGAGTTLTVAYPCAPASPASFAGAAPHS